jgi:hypothetical protein
MARTHTGSHDGRQKHHAARAITAKHFAATPPADTTPESNHSAPAEFADVDAALRRSMIASAAYFLSETRCFEPGHELEDWCRAEKQVDEILNASLCSVEKDAPRPSA